MEFQNCVIFLKESDTDLSTHVEFADNDWHFYAMGNIGDSKKTDSTRLTDPDDPHECIVEVMDNTLPNSTMPTGVYDENDAPVYPISKEQWKPGNPAYDSLYDDTFDEQSADDKGEGAHYDDTYGMRYVYEDGKTDEINVEAREYVITKWREFYEFVVTSTNEEFKAHLGDYIVLKSLMYYYLFTLRYTMTDNHAKNSFYHYGKQIDDEGVISYKWDLNFNYDDDTALGIDNYGRMTYRYGYEEIDYVDGTRDWVWNAPQHVLFLRLRELFSDELSSLYLELESKGAWSANGLINEFNSWQDQFPEELWRLDIERKYIRTYTRSYINSGARPEFLKERANGRKRSQRSQFERNQEKYMSSKFGGTVASNDKAIIRCSVPNTTLAVQPNFDMVLTPYSYMYIAVRYNTTPPIRVRAVPGQPYTINYTGSLADIIEIYSASNLKSIGDLSACYVINGDFASATKIRELNLGSDAEGYNNTNSITLGFGANELLNKLNVQNMSGLTSSLDLSGLKNLRELYARGSNVSGVVFADGGNLEIAELPSVGSLQMKNLNYLTDEGLEVDSYESLTRLVAENSKLDLLNIIQNSPNLYQVRLTGIDWQLGNTELLERLAKLAGISNTGANTDVSILSGTVHVPIIRQQQLAEYNRIWPDLEVNYNTMVQQYTVKFVNYDDSVLEIQYVDKGSIATNPILREDNPLSKPHKPSDTQFDYTFSDWDIKFVPVFEDQTFKAIYTSSVRTYTVKYMANNILLYEEQAEYGSTIEYNEVPTYTAEEGAYRYYLFDRWDKSGFVDGDKTINALFDSCEYSTEYFENKSLSEMRPVEIYALVKSKTEANYTSLTDEITITLGNDIDYDDIDSEVVVDEELVFDGSNYVDTGIKLFDVDKDFVLALDYTMQASPSGSILAQCYQTNGAIGFRLWNQSYPKVNWGTASTSASAMDSREMLVIKHTKGDNKLYVYKSNISGNEVSVVELNKEQPSICDATLVFGCGKEDDGAYENYCNGKIHWCKVWYSNLGDDTCKKLACWSHEPVVFKLADYKRYYLSDNSSQRNSLTFIADHTLSRKSYLHNSSSLPGGWGASKLNTTLNTRIYRAIPLQWRQLIKQVKVPYAVVNNRQPEVMYSDCYLFIPSVFEIDPNMNYEPYFTEGRSTIKFMTTSNTRVCKDPNGNSTTWWTRSPNTDNEYYYYLVTEHGGVSGYYYPSDDSGVRLMFSI